MSLQKLPIPFYLIGCILCLIAISIEPATAQLRVAATNISHSTFQLSWNQLSATNAYTVQYRDGLGDSIWLNAPPTATWPYVAPPWTELRGTPGSQRFYRLLAVERATRGRLISATSTAAYTQAYLKILVSAEGIPLTPLYGVDLFKLDYETMDPEGGRVLASGVVALPHGLNSNLPLVSYQHGTILATNEAPSGSLTTEALLGVVMASTGYMVAAADYVGLGDSPPLHPYHHAKSEATACVDMLRASRTYCTNHGVTLNGKLFLAGYSQGGHATMALHREIEAFHTNEFTITASAPMAGAYDLSGTSLDDFLSSRAKPNPYYYAYLIAAYQDVYHLGSSFADLLSPPYNTTLPPLLHGNVSESVLNAAMPADPRLILKPAYLAAIQSRADHPFRIACRDNDLYAWKPRAPMRLYHCGGDQDVPFANSQVATNAMRSLGATNVILFVPSPTFGHGDCAQPSLLAAKAWFDTMK